MMGRRGALALTALAAVLAGIVVLELGPGSAEKTAMPAPTTRAAPQSRTGQPALLADSAPLFVQAILERPLFALGRRPPSVAAAGPGAPPPALPRVAGILVDGGVRRVIFAAAGADRALVVLEGAQVGGYRVQSIEAGQVTVSGPGGVRVLRPSFDPNPPAPPSAPAGLPGLPGLQLPRLGGIPGLNAPGPPPAR